MVQSQFSWHCLAATAHRRAHRGGPIHPARSVPAAAIASGQPAARVEGAVGVEIVPGAHQLGAPQPSLGQAQFIAGFMRQAQVDGGLQTAQLTGAGFKW